MEIPGGSIYSSYTGISMRKHAVLVHGFNVSDGGKETIATLEPYLRDYNLQSANYGHFGLLGVRMYNKSIAKMLTGMVVPGSIGIGHSNGCAILARACDLGAPIKKLILINPALDRDWKFCDSLEEIIVLHNIHDHVVTKSKWLFNHPWGELGRTGYEGDDPRVINVETYAEYGVEGHSGFFEKPWCITKYL